MVVEDTPGPLPGGDGRDNVQAVSAQPVIVTSPAYACDLGVHVFPTRKYALVLEALRAESAPQALLVLEPPPASRELLARVHAPEYLDDLDALCWTWRTQYSELPLDREVVDAYARAASGTALALREALGRGTAVHLGGGFHHAFADHAEGFCYLNDLAVAIRALQAEGALRRAAVVDLDVHQGNGTAAIFQGDSDVFTLSVHQENNYPMPKQTSDLDFGLADGTGDEAYLGVLGRALERVFAHEPQAVLYQAGADPYVDDLLGGLRLSREGLARRDRAVLEGCAKRGIPCVVTLGGGYARDPWDTVAIHATTCRLALQHGMGMRP